MDALSGLVAQHGLTLVFTNVLIAQLGIPLPAVPMLVVAGALVADGTLRVVPLAVVIVAASLLGDTPWYIAGRRYGYAILRTVCRVSIEPDSCVKQTENIFSRWGPPSLIVAKYIPGFATVAPPLAGTMRVPAGAFVAYSAAAALLWAALPVAAGYFFSTEVERALAWLQSMGTGAAALIVGLVLLYVVVKAVERYMLIRFLRMVRISVADLRGMLGSPRAPVILDVRSPLAREAEPRRIPGALVVQLEQVDRVLDQIPPGREVVVYCS